MKREVMIGGIFTGSFIIVLLIFEGWYLYRAMGPGTLFIGNVTLMMFIICGIGIFALIAYKIKEVVRV